MSTQGNGGRRKASARASCARRTRATCTGAAASSPTWCCRGSSEVAFLRSPVAHARIRAHRASPPGREGRCLRARGSAPKRRPIVAPSTLPSFKLSAQPSARARQGALRRRADRHVRGADARRGRGPREQVEVDIEELPALVDAHAARVDRPCACTRSGTTTSSSRSTSTTASRRRRKQRRVVVKREVALSRQAMVPMEGKAVARLLGRPRQPARGLYLDAGAAHHPHRPRAVPRHRPGAGARRSRPTSAAASATRSSLQPEELCVAWLALKYRRPFRYIEDRREHLVAGANSRQHHYRLTAYADEHGRLLALDAEVTIDGGAYSNWPFTVGARARAGDRQPAGPLRLPRLSLPDRTASRPTSRASCPIAASRAPACASRWN